MLKRLINKFHFLRDRYVLRQPIRAANPYLTHIPILLAVARWRPLTTVLEFGCGDISTRAFLDRRFFPALQRLESYENDAAWAEHLRSSIGNEPRLNLHCVEGAIVSSVDAIDLEQFDLIFIDDSKTGEERSATIRAVAAKRPHRAIVAVHDFECLDYRIASRSFRHRFRFTGLNPNTGLLWNEAAMQTSRLRALDRKLRATGEQADIASWEAALPFTKRSRS
ncbi:MAG: hypothetical protein ABMA26_03735 [Limisphaerales bacterium]